MDDIYEFDNSEYRLASMQVKAIAYDVVTGITRKKINIKKKLEEREEKEELLKKLSDISDKVVELTDDLEQELQKLDDIEEELGEIFLSSKEDGPKQVSPTLTENPAPTEPKKEAPTPQIPTPSPTIPTSQITVPTPAIPTPQITVPTPTVNTPSSTVTETSPKKEAVPDTTPAPITVDLPDIQLTPVIAPVEEKTSPEVPQQPVEATEEPSIEVPQPAEAKEVPPVDVSQPEEVKMEPVQQSEPKIEKTEEPKIESPDESEIKEETSSAEDPSIPLDSLQEQSTAKDLPTLKKRFQKTVKGLSKAIMVRQNQLENLRKSRLKQEQLLANKGLLPELAAQEKEAAKEEELVPMKKELPDDVERKIEDLTVKASIYYNEGEVDKAQEIYDEIKKLNEEYQ